MIEVLQKYTGGEKRPNQNEWADTALNVLHVAYNLLKVYLVPLVADLMLSSVTSSQCRAFFLEITARDAFKVVEVELNFLYDMLYTKAVVVHSVLGFLVRIFLFSLNFSSLAIFYFVKKEDFERFDIGITYTLLLGAIALDLISSLMALYSDRIAVALTKSDDTNLGIRILRNLLNIERRRLPMMCESLPQLNILDYSLHPRSKWWETTIGIFGLTNKLNEMKYVKTIEITIDLRDFIFEELKMRSVMVTDLEIAKKMYSARGEWTLQYEGYPQFLRWTSEVEFDKSLLLWHIATEICFYTNDSDDCFDPIDRHSDDINALRRISKRLSDYMFYLLIVESAIIPTLIGIGQTRFIETCAEAKDFFHETGIERQEEQNIFTSGKELDRVKKLTCRHILDRIFVGDSSKSVFFDANKLAKELKKIQSKKMWKLISKVWVELLSFAACRCKPRTHAAQLSKGKGGQLITLVWLLMANLGLGNQFVIREVHARAEVELDVEEG